MKKILYIALLFIGLKMSAQTYNPVNGTLTNKPLGIAQAVSTDMRSFFYDSAIFTFRPYQDTAEVLSYLNLPKWRGGNFLIYVHSGGVLNANGTYTGGTIAAWWFKDGVTDADLVLFAGSGGSGISTTMQNAYDNSVIAGDVPKINAHTGDLNADSITFLELKTTDNGSIVSGGETGTGGHYENAANATASSIAVYPENIEAGGTKASMTAQIHDTSHIIDVFPYFIQIRGTPSTNIEIQGLDSADAPAGSGLWIDNNSRLHRGGIVSGGASGGMDTAYQRGDSLFGVKNGVEFFVGLAGGAATGVPGTKDTLWYNVKWFGAIGDGVTDDRAAIQTANDYVSAVHGGYIWFPAGVYIVSDAVYRASFVNWEGVKDSSIIRNNNLTHTLFGDQAVMWMGNYNPSSYDTTVARFFRGHMGTFGNKMAIVDSVSKFHVGDVVVIEGMTGYVDATGPWKPYVVRYNEIDSIYSDTVVFHYQVDTLLANARINISGHFITPSDGIDRNGHVKYLVRNVTTRNMVFESEGQWILGMSSLGCRWDNIGIKADELFSGNGMAWTTASNIYGQWRDQVSEFAIGCHNTTIIGVNAHYINRGFTPDHKSYIAFHENVHAVVMKDVFIDAGNYDGNGIRFTGSTECVVDGIHVTSQGLRRTHIEFSDNDLGDQPASFVNSNILRNGYFKNTGNLQNYVLMEKSTSVGQLRNNTVNDVVFVGPVTDATALTLDGYRPELKDLYTTEGEITGGDSLYKGIISGGTIANNYDLHGNISQIFLRSVFDTSGKNRSHFTDIVLKYIPDDITVDGQLHYNQPSDQLNFRHNGVTTDLLTGGGSSSIILDSVVVDFDGLHPIVSIPISAASAKNVDISSEDEAASGFQIGWNATEAVLTYQDAIKGTYKLYITYFQ